MRQTRPPSVGSHTDTTVKPEPFDGHRVTVSPLQKARSPGGAGLQRSGTQVPLLHQSREAQLVSVVQLTGREQRTPSGNVRQVSLFESKQSSTRPSRLSQESNS